MDYSSTSGFDPAILSVCLYTESECRVAGSGNDVHRPGNPVLFGGLISDQSLQDDSDAQSDGQQLSTRPESCPRSYTAVQTENKQSKRSGLRSHSTDKIARRREYLRLAQQAFRQRQNDNISALQERVQQLQGIISELVGLFTDYCMFQDAELLSLNPSRDNQLASMKAKILSLATEAGINTERDDALNMAQKTQRNSLKQLGSRECQTPTTGPSNVSGKNLTNRLSLKPQSGMRTADLLTVDRTGTSNDAVHQQSAFWHTTSDPMRTVSVSGPHTYSYLERTFSRRLHRSCLEYGLGILSNQSYHVNRCAQVFPFHLSVKTRQRVIDGIRKIIRRHPDESLNASQQYPLPVGQSSDSGLDTCPPFGPLNSTNPYTTAEGNHSGIFLEADWLTCPDVEVYLRDRGIILEGHATFSQTTYQIQQLPVNDTHKPMLAFQESAQGLARSELSDPLTVDSRLGESSRGVTLKFAKPRVLDVPSFLRRLVNCGVCLGRAPCFRKYDVEVAFRLSLHEPF